MKKDGLFGMSPMKKSMICAVCIALCVVLPQLFHAIPNAGSIYSPIHIPVLLCGLVCGWQYGLLCGSFGVLFGSLITSMPPVSYMPPMLLECAVYGLLAGLLLRFIRTGHLYFDLYLSLIPAMLGGRLAAGAFKILIFARGTFTWQMWAAGYFVTGLPGIIIHLILVPALVAALIASRLIPSRYPGKGSGKNL